MTTMNDTEWMRKAACKDYPLPEFEHYWFPAKPSEMLPEARAICDGCPVNDKCDKYITFVEAGVSAKNRYGNWNGRTPPERVRRYRSELLKAKIEREKAQREREQAEAKNRPWNDGKPPWNKDKKGPPMRKATG